MELFVKATAAVLIAAIFCVVLSNHGKDISLLLSLAACCMLMVLAASYLRPVLDFLERLTELGGINEQLVSTLLKITGIGLISQIAVLICTDSGNQTLAKALQMMTTALVLCLSVPLLEETLFLIEGVLGGA